MLSDAHPSSLKVSHPRSRGNSFPLTFFYNFLSVFLQCIFEEKNWYIFYLTYFTEGNSFQISDQPKDNDKDKDKTQDWKIGRDSFSFQVSLQFPNSQIPKCSTPFLPILITMSICPGPPVCQKMVGIWFFKYH